MAKGKSMLIWWLVGGLALFLILENGTANAMALPEGTDINLDSFSGQYPAANIQALKNLYANLLDATDPNTGEPLSNLQIQMLLSQALVETGLFTSSPNWTLVNGNNFSGITAHGSYPANANGTFAKYPDIATFVNDWLNILSHNVEPLEANDIADFNNRLKTNNYYGSDNPVTYGSNLQTYFDLLNPVNA